MGIEDHLGTTDFLDNIEDILGEAKDIKDPTIYSDPAKVDKLVSILRDLSKDGTGVAAYAPLGLFVKGRVMKHHFAISAFDLPEVGGSPRIDLNRIAVALPSDPNSIANNDSKVVLKGIEPREFAVSYARSLLADRLFVGANLKLITGTTYFYEQSILESDNEIIDMDKFTENKKTSTDIGLDIGVIYLPIKRLRIGLTARDINSPSFTSKGGDIDLDSQVRCGVAFIPFKSLRIAADIDLTENSSLIEGSKDRRIGFGAEKGFLSKHDLFCDNHSPILLFS